MRSWSGLSSAVMILYLRFFPANARRAALDHPQGTAKAQARGKTRVSSSTGHCGPCGQGRHAHATAPHHNYRRGRGRDALEKMRKVGLFAPACERMVVHPRPDHVEDVRDPLLPERRDLLRALDAADVQPIENFVNARRVPRSPQTTACLHHRVCLLDY